MISTLILDIECTDLAADRGVMLCACYESSEAPGKVQTLRNDVIARSDWAAGRRSKDKELVKTVRDLVLEHDVIVAHNGKRFDLPFIRTRCLRWNLKPLPEVKVVDPLLIARNKFALRSNRLGAISDHLGISDRKTPLDLSIWASAMLDGDKASMDLIVEHCVADVKVLSGVLKHVKPFIRVLDEKGSGL